MNDYFQHNRRSLFILAGLFFILAIVLYFILLRPLFSDIKSAENNVQLKKEEIELLQAQLDNAEVIPEENIDQLILEQRIPLERKLDDYIVSLQRLEAVTNSKFEKIEFVYDSNLEIVEDEESTEESIENLESQGEKAPVDEETDDEVETEEISIDPAILNEKPDSLHVMTVKVTAGAREFEDLIDLLEAIENTERISIVTALAFEQPTEADIYHLEEDPLEYIPFEAEITTFYYTE